MALRHAHPGRLSTVEILGRGNSSSVVVALLDLDGTVGPLPYTLGAKFFGNAPSQEHHVLLCPCTPDSLHTHSVCPLKQQRSQCHNFYKCSTLVLPLHQWSSQEDLLISPASDAIVNVNVIVVHSKVSHMISLQGFQHLGPWALLNARCGMPQQLSVSVVNRTETEHSWSSSGAMVMSSNADKIK